jgi:circadian clock protein KaiC
VQLQGNNDLAEGRRKAGMKNLPKEFEMSDSPNGTPQTTGRVSTGIPGLDDILNGGKTTVALQFLLSGLQKGEQGLYVTLSESKHELEGVAESHGWSLAQLPIYEMAPLQDEIDPEAQYTIFHPSDVELSDTISSVLKQVDSLTPQRVVFDSLSELRMLARDPLRYRRQILGLKRYFAGRKCTVLLLDDRTAEGNDLQLQSIAHGVVMLQSLERDFGIKRRRLEVRKLRGSKFREGFHDYNIETGQVVVYPRLVAAEHKPGFVRQFVSSGVKSLDDLLGGGLHTGTSTLLMGPAGSGKSTIAMQYALAAAERGERSVLFTFDESLATLLERAKGLGMDFTAHIDAGTIQIQQIDPAELSPGEFVTKVRDAVDHHDAKIIVIDSLNGFLSSMPNEQALTLQLHDLLAYLGQQGVAAMMTLSQHGFVGYSMNTPVDVSYLADSVLLFRYYEVRGEVKQAISVVKKRTGGHERTIRELSFGKDGIRVGEALRRFEGVLTGTPRFIEQVGVNSSASDDQ